MHRIRLPRGTVLTVEVGAQIRPDEVIGLHREPMAPIRVPVTAPLRRPLADLDALLTVRPGNRVAEGDPIARDEGGREVRAPVTGLMVSAMPVDGTVLIAPLGPEQPVVGHIRGRIRGLEEQAVVVEVPGARLRGVGGSGDAVHGELMIGVRNPEDELRAGAIDSAATGKILVGGSRASAEALTRARAMGVAGIVLGGVLDKELRDFEAIQRRRQQAGGLTGSFGILLLEGFGKVSIDPQMFGWLTEQNGKMASLVGAEQLLYIYDSGHPPARRSLPKVGERVIAHRRPFQGRTGVLVALLEEAHAAQSGIPARTGLVRFEDGRLAPLPLANIEAIVRASEP
jgi:hypothetical protein